MDNLRPRFPHTNQSPQISKRTRTIPRLRQSRRNAHSTVRCIRLLQRNIREENLHPRIIPARPIRLCLQAHDGFQMLDIVPRPVWRTYSIRVNRISQCIKARRSYCFSRNEAPVHYHQPHLHDKNERKKESLPSPIPLPDFLGYILNLATPPYISRPHTQSRTPPEPTPEPCFLDVLITDLVPVLNIRTPENVPVEIHPHARPHHALGRIVQTPRACPFSVKGLGDEEYEDGQCEAEAQELVGRANGEGGDGG
jgi:hypothetical protein